MKTLQESLLDKLEDQTSVLKREAIEEWLKKNNRYSRATYTINDDYTIDISAFEYGGTGDFPSYIQFRNCKLEFRCCDCKMTTLQGCPSFVGDNFYCYRNQLKNLIGGPKEVLGKYSCMECGLESLEGAPEIIRGSFYCHDNKLKNLKYGPKEVRGAYSCSSNQITTLEYYPDYVSGVFYCWGNKLSTKELEWGSKHIHCSRFDGLSVHESIINDSLLDKLDDQTKDLKRLQIEEWLKENNKVNTDYSINSDYTIDIDRFQYKGKGNFPDYIQFNKCKRGFICPNKEMTSLRGCPQEVGEWFDCSYNPLRNLVGGPKRVGDDFDCQDCHLMSTEGLPEEIGGSLIINGNDFKFLDKVPNGVSEIIVNRDQLDPVGERRLRRKHRVLYSGFIARAH